MLNSKLWFSYCVLVPSEVLLTFDIVGTILGIQVQFQQLMMESFKFRMFEDFDLFQNVSKSLLLNLYFIQFNCF